MEIEIENEGVLDLACAEELLDRNGNIVEVTEAPAGMGTGMMPRRPDQAKGGFSLAGHFCSQDGPACCETTDFIDETIVLDGSDMLPSVDSFDVPVRRGFGFRKFEFTLEGLYDCFHPARHSRRIVGVDFVKPLVKDDLHGFSPFRQEMN